MAVSIKTETSGGPEYTRALKSASLRNNPKILSVGFRKIGLLVQSVAAREKIHPGGRGVPLAHALTSRTGTGRRSIRGRPWRLYFSYDSSNRLGSHWLRAVRWERVGQAIR